jgi:Ser/Thr protein kinase RdoA (MazF antagonist)
VDDPADGTRAQMLMPPAAPSAGGTSAIDNLEEPPPPVSTAEATWAAHELFGLRVDDVQELPGERDRNFLLTVAGGDRFVMKVVHPAEDDAISDFQTRLLAHLAARQVPAQRVVSPIDGRQPSITLDGPPTVECRVRCVTYLPGARLSDATPTPARWGELGRFLAGVDRALEDFAHPQADRPFLWDLKRADQLRPLVQHIADRERRRRVAEVLDTFAAEIRPRLAAVRSQVIHNDANPQNVLVAADEPDRIGGVIDFGDAVHAPVVQEIAVPIAYQSLRDPTPFCAAVAITRGYHEVSPLDDDELVLIPALVATRLAVTTVITSWRSALHPENAHYIMRNDATIGANLSLISKLLPPDFAAAVVDNQPLPGGLA